MALRYCRNAIEGRIDPGAMKKNGFLTFYVLWMGMIMLAVSVAVSALSIYSVRLAEQYEESVQLAYEAESVLTAAWDEVSRRSWQDVPAKKTWRFDDAYNVIRSRHYAEIQCISSPYELPFSGTLRAAAVAERSLMQRTYAYVFEISTSDDGESARFAVQNIIY